MLHRHINITQEVNVLRGLGNIHRHLGNSHESIRFFEKALSKAKGKLPEQEADVMRELAFMYNNLGNKEKSLEYTEESLNLSREKGFRKVEASAMAMRGHLFEGKNDYLKALPWYYLALKICQQEKHLDREITLTSDIGRVYGIIGQYIDSFTYLNTALKLAEMHHKVFYTIVIYHRLGNSYLAIEDYANAKEYLNKSIELSRSKGFLMQEAECLRGLADFYLKRNEKALAMETLEKVVDIFDKANYIRHKLFNLKAIGQYYENMGEFAKALKTYLRIINSFKDFYEYLNVYVQTLESIGLVLHKMGTSEKADKLISIAKQIQDTSGSEGVFKDFSKKAHLNKLLVEAKNLLASLAGIKNKFYQRKEISLNLEKLEATKKGKPVILTPQQWQILKYLIENPGKYCSQKEIHAAVSGYGEDIQLETATIRSQISRIRKLLVDEFIKGKSKKGYKIA